MSQRVPEPGRAVGTRGRIHYGTECFLRAKSWWLV